MAKIDAYEAVTANIIAKLEEGTVPWHKPWDPRVGMPRNLDGRAYRGINVLLLGQHQYDDPRWGTFKAIQEKGGCVKKGEKGQIVIFFKFLESKTEVDAKGKPKKIPMIRYFYLFNVNQTEGLDLPELETTLVPQVHTDEELIAAGEAVWAGYQDAPSLTTDRVAASYNPGTDAVRMPDKSRFETLPEYYGTLFHEAVHSTGHKDRLNRPDLYSDGFGSDKYSREELVAEMGSAMIAARAGIEVPTDNTAAYIASWLNVLGEDKKMVVSAATRASAAADWILDGPKED